MAALLAPTVQERQMGIGGSLATVTSIRLLKLHLRNFKGITDFTLDTQGRNVNIYGDNATGKTTIFDAFTWLLFDKDSQNKKDFEIKTLGPDGEPLHGLEHEVEATLEVSGTAVTLRKVFRERWTKKRGSAIAEFTGHTTDYYINDVPVKKSDYDAWISTIINEDAFKLLTSPTYFNEQLHWQERRRILMGVCGDVTDEDVIASDKRLARLPEILRGRSLEDHRKIIAARRAEINKELERIPVRIDEVHQGLPHIADIDPDKLAEDIKRLRLERDAKLAELSRIQNGGEIAEKTRQLRQAEAELLEMENQFKRGIQAQIYEHQKNIDSLYNQMRQLDAMSNLTLIDTSDLEHEIEQLRKKWQEVAAQEFRGSDTCPTCGQPLPYEQIEAARASFNRHKAEELERITATGKAKVAELKQRQIENEERRRKADEARAKADEVRKQIAEAQSEINRLKATTGGDPAIVAKRAEIESLEQAIADLRAGGEQEAAAIRAEISRLNDAIAALEKAAAAYEQRKRGEARIEELKAEERRLAAEFEKLEQELYLTEEFIRTKVRLLEERINSCFKLARFKLFDTQINGGITECCETTYQGVPYRNLNHGARLNVGLDIINTLAEHYRFVLPVWIDNAEAVTQILPTRSQQIRLIVSATDKRLRVETEGS